MGSKMGLRRLHINRTTFTGENETTSSFTVKAVTGFMDITHSHGISSCTQTCVYIKSVIAINFFLVLLKTNVSVFSPGELQHC